ncbi:Pyruvate dehydrogenase [ubiquinone] [Rothia kristinae]|nr:Pyruvate dehydrogenase [ubiquinone] [Rothia kristinae]
MVASAIRHAVGDSGVAVVTIPGDIADEDTATEAPVLGTLRRAPKVPHQETIQELASHINRAKKVALFVGAGIEGAHDEVVSLAEKAAAPVGHSLRGKDFIQYDNPSTSA